MFSSTKIIELGSCAFRQPQAESHCRFLHGYRLTAKFWFEASTLDHNNWVVDFGGLKGLKQLMKHQFDHTTCISRTDPKLEQFKRLRDEGVCDLRVMDGVGIEKFAEYCHIVADSFVDELTDGRCSCVKVEVFEHESNSAIYSKYETQRMSFPGDRGERGRLPEPVEFSEEVKSGNQMKRGEAFTTKKEQMDQVEQNTKSNITQPPFAKNTPAPVKNKKQTNKWIDPDSKSTWGI